MVAIMDAIAAAEEQIVTAVTQDDPVDAAAVMEERASAPENHPHLGLLFPLVRAAWRRHDTSASESLTAGPVGSSGDEHRSAKSAGPANGRQTVGGATFGRPSRRFRRRLVDQTSQPWAAARPLSRKPFAPLTPPLMCPIWRAWDTS